LAPTSGGNEEEETLIPPIADKPVQKEAAESKRTGSVGSAVFLGYIRAGGCGIFGLSCLFAIFALTSAIVLLANWWLGRWSNSERIRYSLTDTTNNCSSNQQSKISTMSNEEWFAERDKLFYVLLGE